MLQGPGPEAHGRLLLLPPRRLLDEDRHQQSRRHRLLRGRLRRAVGARGHVRLPQPDDRGAGGDQQGARRRLGSVPVAAGRRGRPRLPRGAHGRVLRRRQAGPVPHQVGDRSDGGVLREGQAMARQGAGVARAERRRVQLPRPDGGSRLRRLRDEVLLRRGDGQGRGRQQRSGQQGQDQEQARRWGRRRVLGHPGRHGQLGTGPGQPLSQAQRAALQQQGGRGTPVLRAALPPVHHRRVQVRAVGVSRPGGVQGGHRHDGKGSRLRAWGWADARSVQPGAAVPSVVGDGCVAGDSRGHDGPQSARVAGGEAREGRGEGGEENEASGEERGGGGGGACSVGVAVPRRHRRVPAVLDELRIAEEQKRLDKLALVTVTLHAKTAGALVGIVLDKEETGGALVVSEVGGLALESARVAVGFVLVRIGGGEVATEGALPRELSAGQKLELTFRRPRPVIPARGAARETIHKEPRFVLHAEQGAYLVEVVLQPLLRGEQPPRPIVVFLSMKSKFGNKMRMDTRTPMWLEKPQIEKWIAEKKKEIKQKKKQPPQSTTPQQEPKSKKAKSASKKGKAKKKAPPQKEACSSKDDKDDDGDSDEEESDDDGGMDDGDWF
mmetsp:Transcript_54569/g.124292  ORF Transcript_54569/g.124292 Transcript_54569/m.124292 type:complete len:609 (-) Transcript_54569:104-1930(-)